MSPTLTTSGTPYLQQQPSPHSSAAAAMTEDGMGAHIYAVCVLLLQLYLIIILCANAFSEYLLTFSTPPPPSSHRPLGRGAFHQSFTRPLVSHCFCLVLPSAPCRPHASVHQLPPKAHCHSPLTLLCCVLCCAVPCVLCSCCAEPGMAPPDRPPRLAPTLLLVPGSDHPPLHSRLCVGLYPRLLLAGGTHGTSDPAPLPAHPTGGDLPTDRPLLGQWRRGVCAAGAHDAAGGQLWTGRSRGSSAGAGEQAA